MSRRLVLVCALTLVPRALLSGESADLSMVTRIRDEAFTNSKVMETLSYLSDVIGPRLTGSPQMKKANEWTRQQLESWGIANAHLESWGPFGEGWTLERCAVHMTLPEAAPLIAVAKAWTPGTNGAVRGRATRVKIESETDVGKYKGKLAGMIVFLGEPPNVPPIDRPLMTRYSDRELEDLARFEPRSRAPLDREAIRRRAQLQATLLAFFAEEKALAVVEPSALSGGTIRVTRGGSYRKGEPKGVTSLVMAVEHYNRVVRILDRRVDVELELDVKATFHDEDLMGYNTIAEIPGTEVKKGEVVMVGAHLDSWHAGTGATDNAAGTAVALEAFRILKALNVAPRRSIRIGLWSGEEQGLLGSRAYVGQHFASRPEPEPSERALPSALRQVRGPLTVKSEHGKLSAYFNLDNGTGKIRGIYVQGNAAVVPIFETWLQPFKDVGAQTVTMRNTAGTDHVPFDQVGLPGFQFIQDTIEYDSRSHHTNMDVVDRIQREDLMQASAIMASFLYNAATREEMIPRKPMPKDAVGPGPHPPPAEQPPRKGGSQ